MYQTEGLVGVDDGVKFPIVEFVVSIGGKKRPDAVGGKFPLHPVGSGKRRVDDGGNDEKDADDGHPCGPRSRKMGAFPEAAQKDHRKNGGGGRYGRKQRKYGIGFGDVADHLRGIDQIIHGDEVETASELIPEQCFGHGPEKERAAVQPEYQRKNDSSCSSAPEMFFQKQKGKYGQGEQNAGEKVIDRAPEIDGAQSRQIKGTVQCAMCHDEQRRSDRGVHDQPEQKKQREIPASGISETNHGRLLNGMRCQDYSDK